MLCQKFMGDIHGEGRTILHQLKIVHAADFHLESNFSGWSATKADDRRQELKAAFQRVIDLALKEDAQLLLLAGDIFEHSRADRELMHMLNQGFAKLDCQVFIAPGNHDPGIAGSPYWSYTWSPNVHIFTESFAAFELPDLNCVVYGLGFAHFAVKESLLADFRVADQERLNIVVMHGEDHSNPLAGGSSNYLPFTITELAAAGADYYALGHYHRPRTVWEDGGRVRACYPGSPEPLGFDEEGDHGVLCGTLSKNKTDLRFVKLNQRSYRTFELRCQGQEFLDELVQLAVAHIPEAERQRDIFRLVYRGEVEPSLEFDRGKLESMLEPYFYHCRAENATVPRYDLQAFDGKTVRGMFVARIQALLETTSDEAEKEMLRESLYIGLDSLNLGKVVER